jgi:WD40 repeat protein
MFSFAFRIAHIVISASNDCSLRYWHVGPNPSKSTESITTSEPIGFHHDYVKSLAFSSDLNWILSGGLDNRIGVWDANRIGQSCDPICWRMYCAFFLCKLSTFHILRVAIFLIQQTWVP